MIQPPWLKAAWAEFGVAEVAGVRDAAAILSYYKEAGHPAIKHDEIAWCAAFAGAMLSRAGVKGSGSLLARSYLTWGDAIEVPRFGAVAVLSRGQDPGAGHVGFWLGEAKGKVFLLGGNQSDAVSVAAFEASRVLGYRWPAGVAENAPVGSSIFESALAHVLEMEGEFTDDPYDPGGPTNKGITLETFARWKALTLDATNRVRLVEDLKHIPAETVRAIYQARYWKPGRCGELSDPLALFHFDACVNHGVAGAAKLLQQALDVEVDGEIGPETLAAARAKSTRGIIESYADVRRARYRALPHFWRFGRGWLNRVDKTRAKALAETGQAPTSKPQAHSKSQTEGPDNMDTPNTIELPNAKWWAHSKTIWGALITAAAAILPALGPLIGINLPGDVIRQAGEQLFSAAQVLGALFGTLLAIYGRVSAVERLTRRDVNVRI